MNCGPRGRVAVSVTFVFALLLLSIGTARAQSAIAGQVTDITGAVLPGVNVEVKSAALIEGTKSAVTDGEGRYQVPELRPGIYTITFTLQGFGSVVREGLDLPANFTAPVAAQMKVGDLSETITVSGDSPLIDVQRTVVQQTLKREVIDALPAPKSFWSVGSLLPSVVPERSASASRVDVGGSTMMNQGRVTSHGSDTNDLSLELDGISNFWRFTWVCMCSYQNENAAAEIVYQTSGQAAETSQSGVRINLIPKEGGNRFGPSGYVNFANRDFAWSNITPELVNAGLSSGPSLDKTFDYNAQLGGPLMPNKLWFFAAYRYWGYNQAVPNTFEEDGSQGVDDNFAWNAGIRLTYQVTPRNKISGSYSKNPKYQHRLGLASGVDPVATSDRRAFGNYLANAKWTSTVSSRWLADVGWTMVHYEEKSGYQPNVKGPSAANPFGDVRVVDSVLGTTKYAHTTNLSHPWDNTHTVKGTVSYVTGSFQNKFGGEFIEVDQHSESTATHGDITQLNYVNGVATSAQVNAGASSGSLTRLLGGSLFNQATKTLGRATINAGVRWEYYTGSTAARELPASRFVGPRSYGPTTGNPGWNMINPRLGLSYDIFNNAKTALKVNVGRYITYIGTQYVSDYGTAVTSTDTRTWNDRDRNGANLLTNNNGIAEDNEIGPLNNALFGVSSDSPGRLLSADSKAPYQWVYDISVQHQLFPALAVTAGVYMRNFYNVLGERYAQISDADFALIDIPNPLRSGATVPVYNVDNAKRTLLLIEDYTSDESREYRGFEVDVLARLPRGGRLSGGWDVGRTVKSTCALANPNSRNFCNEFDYDMPFLHTFKINGTYPVAYGFQVGLSASSIPGIDQIVNYTVTRAQVPTLSLPSVVVRINEPGRDYYERISSMDLHVDRTFRFRGQRLIPELNVYNLTGANAILATNDNVGPNLGLVQNIMLGRSAKIGLRWDF